MFLVAADDAASPTRLQLSGDPRELRAVAAIYAWSITQHFSCVCRESVAENAVLSPSM